MLPETNEEFPWMLLFQLLDVMKTTVLVSGPKWVAFVDRVGFELFLE